MTRYVAIFLAGIFTLHMAIASEFDPDNITVSAADAVEAELLKGEHYTVNEEVTVDGHTNYFTVVSDFGEFTAVGNFGLRKLRLEIEAIATLKEQSSTDAGTAAVTGVITGTGESVAAVVTNPVGTVKGLSGGVSRYFKRTTRKAKDFSKKAGETLKKDDEEAEETEETVDETTEDEDSGISATEVSKKVADSFLGIGKAHRELARELKVDPYSKNEVLQAELQRVAKITGSTSKITRILLPMPSFIGSAKKVSNMVWNLRPLDLLIQNEETLEDAGYKKKEFEAFFSNPAYSPTQQTILVSILESLAKVEGAKALLSMAASAETDVEAEFLIRALLFTKLHHEHLDPVVELLHGPDRLATVALTESGDAVIFAPVDHLLWTEDVALATQQLNTLVDANGVPGNRVFWVGGKISDKALAGLNDSGWSQSSEQFKVLEDMARQQVDD